MIRKFLVAVVSTVVVVSTVIVAAGAASASSGGEYQVGVSLALTGPLGSYGVAAKDLWQAYVNGVNASGGVDGHKVNLSFLDDQASTTTAAANMLEFTQKKVVGVMGGYISTQCTAMTSIATRTKTPLICNTVDPTSFSPAPAYVFAAGNVEVREVAPLYKLTSQLTHSKKGLKVAIVATDDAGGLAWLTKMKAAASAKGDTVVATQTLPITATSITTQAAAIVAAKPDVVFMSIVGAFILPLDRALRTADITAPLIGEADTGLSPSIFSSVGDPHLYTDYPVETLLTPTIKSGALGAWVKQLKKLGLDTEDKMNAGLGTQTGLVAVAMVAGLKECGWPCTGPKLDAALDKTDVSIPGLVQGLKYTKTQHYGVTLYNALGWSATSKKVVKVASGLAVGTS